MSEFLFSLILLQLRRVFCELRSLLEQPIQLSVSELNFLLERPILLSVPRTYGDFVRLSAFT